MNEISELWEDLKFEAGSIGNELLPKDRQEVYIGMGDRNADVLFIGNDPKLYLAEDYKVETQNSEEFELIYKKLHDAILNVRNYNSSNIVIYQEHDTNKHFYKLLNKKSLKKIFFMGFIVLAFIYFIYSFVLGRQSQSILDQLNSLLG